MYNYTLNRGKKYFYHYCLKTFSTEEILKLLIKDCFNINGKQRIIMPKKDEYVKFTYYERKINSQLIIYADFESILVPEGNIQRSVIETNVKNIFLVVMAINQHILMISLVILLRHSYVKMLFKSLLVVLSNKVNVTVTWHFNKELGMTKDDKEDLKNYTKCWFCDNDYADNDVKVRYH